MTVKGIIHFVTLCACLSEPMTKIWMKIDPYYQRRKCSSETLCEALRVTVSYRIGVGLQKRRLGSLCVLLLVSHFITITMPNRRGSLDEMRVVSSKIAIFASCRSYIFRNLIYETKIIMSESEYVVPKSTSKQLSLVQTSITVSKASCQNATR